MKKEPPEVALVMKADTDWHRSVLMGVGQFGEDSGGWNFTLHETDSEGRATLPKSWHGDGIIFRATSDELGAQIRETGVPAVNVSWLNHAPDLPSVISDEVACARMAGRFLMEKQFENFAYIGFPPALNYSTKIEDTLREEYASRGVELHVFEYEDDAVEVSSIRNEHMREWLVSLPQPVAIVVWSSDIGYLVTTAAREAGINIPQTLSIICIEHDPLWSMLAPVPLSNVDQDPWRVGYTAGKLLLSLMRGAPEPESPVLISPISIVQRLSTEASAVKDPVLRDALNLIYERGRTGVTVKEIVSQLGISRRALESRFRKMLNCSPALYIRRLQLRHVARLLRTTRWSISAIAKRTGFVYPEVLMRSFKREFGMTPMQFRGAGAVSTKAPSTPASLKTERGPVPPPSSRKSARAAESAEDRSS